MFSVQSTYAVLLAGGQSSRLFPFNKVLSDLTGSGRTLIQQAADRATKGFIDRRHLFVLTGQAFVPMMRQQLKLPAGHFLTDPVRRGTWPALLWAMAHLRGQDPEATLAVMTGDHLIPNVPAFRKSVTQALTVAQTRPAIVMIGVAPTSRPQDWRGFGSLKAAASSSVDGLSIAGFEEKPTEERAAEMIAETGWLWNAGMFFFRIRTAEQALQAYQPAMAEVYQRVVKAVAEKKPKEAACLYENFPAQIPHPLTPSRHVDNTIDYAIMTPLVHQPREGLGAWVAAEPLREWADVGEWTALCRHVSPDRQGNFCVGRVKARAGAKSCILAADSGRGVDVAGVEGMIIAFSGKKALVIPIAECGLIKQWVAEQSGAAMVTRGAETLDIRMTATTLTVRPRRPVGRKTAGIIR